MKREISSAFSLNEESALDIFIKGKRVEATADKKRGFSADSEEPAHHEVDSDSKPVTSEVLYRS
jgi:hypothetical protein